jgi:hypothetical protein
MKLNRRIATRRWMSAILVACGAITFAAADGYSYIRRLYVTAWTNNVGACNTYPNQFVGIAEMVGPSYPACKVVSPAQNGSTNQSNIRCPVSDANSPTAIARAGYIDTTTGDVTVQVSGNAAGWGSTSSLSTNLSGCTVNVLATGQ